MIQRVSGLDVGNVPNGSVEIIQDTILNNGSKGSLDQMTDAEKIAYQARKRAEEEETDVELMRAMGRDITTPRATAENVKMLLNGKDATSAQPVVTKVTTPILQTVPTQSVKASKGMPTMTAEKDELSVPIHKVTDFIRLVMGENFGYISKDMAVDMVNLIPKDCALLAIETSEDYAKKFLQYNDSEVKRAAMKRVFGVNNDDELAPYEKMITMGFEINPWKE